MHFPSFHPSPSTGGVCLSIARHLSTRFQHQVSEQLLPGRCVRVRLSNDTETLCLTCIHLDPALPTDEKKSLLSRVIHDSTNPAETHFIAGDFNFITSDEDRLRTECQHTHHNDPISSYFTHHSDHLTELYQEDFTRRGRRRHQSTPITFARLDRTYTSIPPAELFLRSPYVRITHHTSNPHFPSDHVPVSATITRPPTGPPQRKVVPSWITRLPSFAPTVADVLCDAPLPDNPLDGIVQASQILHAASDAVKLRMHSCEATTTTDKLFWTIKLLHTIHHPCTTSHTTALRAYPYLAQLIPDWPASPTEHGRVCEHIQELSNIQLDEQTQALQEDDLPEWKKRGRKAALHRRRQFWSTRTRKTHTLTILHDDHTPLPDNQTAAAALRDHWQPTFTARNTLQPAIDEILQHANRIPDTFRWCLTYDEFKKVAIRLTDSSPGPDGLPYSAWTHAGDTILDLLYRAYLSLLNFTDIPPALNHSLLIFIPKGEHDDTQHHCQITAGHTTTQSLKHLHQNHHRRHQQLTGPAVFGVHHPISAGIHQRPFLVSQCA